MFNHVTIETLENRRLLTASAFPIAIASAGFDFAAAIATDRSNNVIVAGERNVFALEDGPPAVNTPGVPSGNFVSKFAPDGTLLWSRLFGAGNISKVATDAETASISQARSATPSISIRAAALIILPPPAAATPLFVNSAKMATC